MIRLLQRSRRRWLARPGVWVPLAVRTWHLILHPTRPTGLVTLLAKVVAAVDSCLMRSTMSQLKSAEKSKLCNQVWSTDRRRRTLCRSWRRAEGRDRRMRGAQPVPSTVSFLACMENVLAMRQWDPGGGSSSFGCVCARTHPLHSQTIPLLSPGPSLREAFWDCPSSTSQTAPCHDVWLWAP